MESDTLRFEFTDGTEVTLKATTKRGRREPLPLDREQWETVLKEMHEGVVTGVANGRFRGVQIGRQQVVRTTEVMPGLKVHEVE